MTNRRENLMLIKLFIKFIETIMINVFLGIVNIILFGSIAEKLILIFLIVFFLIGLVNNQLILYISIIIIFIIFTNIKK